MLVVDASPAPNPLCVLGQQLTLSESWGRCLKIGMVMRAVHTRTPGSGPVLCCHCHEILHNLQRVSGP